MKADAQHRIITNQHPELYRSRNVATDTAESLLIDDVIEVIRSNARARLAALERAAMKAEMTDETRTAIRSASDTELLNVYREVLLWIGPMLGVNDTEAAARDLLATARKLAA